MESRRSPVTRCTRTRYRKKPRDGVVCRPCGELVPLDVHSIDWRERLDEFVEDHYSEHDRFDFAVCVAL